MPERHKALFRGARNANGTPAEWLDDEGTQPGPDGAPQPPEPAVPARHLTDAEYAALSPRNKQRVREARAADGGPLYEVRSDKELTAPASRAEKSEKSEKSEKEA